MGLILRNIPPATVWTAHIVERIQPRMWVEWPKPRFLGVFATELEAANFVRETRVAGFDEEGWVQEWDLKAAQTIYRVTVFDKEWTSG